MAVKLLFFYKKNKLLYFKKNKIPLLHNLFHLKMFSNNHSTQPLLRFLKKYLFYHKKHTPFFKHNNSTKPPFCIKKNLVPYCS